MKITQFILTLGMGGAEAVVRDYCLEFKKRGHDVEVIVLFPRLHNSNEDLLEKAGITIRCIYEEIFLIKKYGTFFRWFRKPYRTLLVRKWVKDYLGKNKIDVLHAHLGLLRYIPSGVCSKNNTRLFFTCHNEASYYFGNKSDPDYKAAVKLIDIDRMKIFALHTRMKNELNEIFHIETCEVMNNPVNLYRFQHPKKSREEIRKEFGFAEDDFIVGHVGRFVDQKNHNFLIDIFVEILKLRKNAKLLLVGEGPLQDTIKEKCITLGIEDKVFFTGVRTDVPEIMSGMDVFLFPSKFEGLGIVLIEAQINIRKVLASNKVPKDVAVSNSICFIGIEESPELWAKICCFKNTDFVKPVNNIADFDIKTVISRLESFYAV